MTVRIGTGSSAVDPSALRVAGVSPSKIMLGTGTSAVEVWTAVITVTPQAPTFLTASPWYTLPTQAGVTYAVSGTPGYSQTVTITATPQAGYELAGQTSWTHTYGPPPSIYPQSGTWGPTSLSSSYTTRASHTIAEAGLYTITHSVKAAGNNTRSRISGPWGATTGSVVNNGGTSTATTTQTLSPGSVINFQAIALSGSSHTGSWSIVKN